MNTELQLIDQDFSFLGKGTKVKGEFHLSGITHIACQLEGKLFMEKEMDLYIERDGLVKGNIEGHNIEIHGRFEGNILSTGKISIFPPAQISGKINAKHLMVFPGAVLDIEYHTKNDDDAAGPKAEVVQ
jgi:cytoskeletal protein CcmA (bactofilin family)